MFKTLGAALLLASGLTIAAAGPAFAVQVIVTGVDKGADGTATYHYAIKTDPGETLTPGVDFVTVYNFSLVDGSAKTPDGWTFSSAEFGKTPTWHGYPVVGPVDMPGLSNLTWTPTATVSGGTQVDGFSATTRVAGTIDGEYTAQVTVSSGGKSSEQAVIGHIPSPSYLK
jgi:hypothetical protein